MLYCVKNPFNIASTNKKNKMDLIYLIIITPIAIAAMFIVWKLKQYSKDINRMPEAKPYEFEKDKYLPTFDEYTQSLYQHKFYKGKGCRS